MDEITGIVCVPAIVVIVYVILELYKLVLKGEKWLKLIPIWAALCGAVFGVIAYFAAPEIMPAGDVVTAILIGMISGLAATGTNQILKQLKKRTGEKPMARYELTIYGENDEVVKKYETDRLRWGVLLQAIRLNDEIKGKNAVEQFSAINKFVKAIFSGLTDEELDMADMKDVLNTFKQIISAAGAIETAKNE